MKKIFFILLIIPNLVYAGELPASKAVGVFFAVGVGPRLPVGSFASTTDLGYGVNLELSYTDSDNLPFFAFARIGFEQYPGSRDFYQVSDYSNFSTEIVPASLGVRYYFSPLVEDVVLLIPVAEVSACVTYLKTLHEFKPATGRTNFTDEVFKFGFSAGVGVSMFLLEILTDYNYFSDNQYLSFNINLRLPILVNL